tara:strand:- start:196 stop:465 length:270 start_codon:yes stop_codon:yes gene_type:complete
VFGGNPPQILKIMKKTLLGLIALPLSLIGVSDAAMAYGYTNSSYYPNSFSINGSGGYSGRYNRIGNFHSYSDNYGSTRCSAIGSYISCN